MYSTFVDYFEKLNETTVHLILHHNADPDALCAAAAFGYLISKLNSNVNYKIYSDNVNTSATRIMEEMGVKVEEDLPELSQTKSNIVFTVDTANFSQLGKYSDWVDKHQLPLVVVDHHDTSELDDKAVCSIIDSETSSTCILAFKAFKEKRILPTNRIATLIMSGHLYDSRRFLYGTTLETLEMFSDLIKCGGDYELANRLLQNEMSHGEKIARLKSAQRLQYASIGDQIVVATSRIRAFEASAARSLLSMGADIALVIAPKDEELRGSARAMDYLEINIGEIMSILASEFEGSGGGHAAAAGFNISPTPSKKIQNKILKRFTEIVEMKLTSQETN